MSDLLDELNAALSGVVESARRSLVQIHNGRHGAGAGIVCHPEGLIVTNAHVVDHPGLRVVLADERVLPARLLAHDAQRDLAVLTVDTADCRPSSWVIRGACSRGSGSLPWATRGA
jgi:S1-C subfamily serine protease